MRVETVTPNAIESTTSPNTARARLTPVQTYIHVIHDIVHVDVPLSNMYIVYYSRRLKFNTTLKSSLK